MVKEAVICIIIVGIIFGLEMFTQNFTKETVSEITETMSHLKDAILTRNNENVDNEIKNLSK